MDVYRLYWRPTPNDHEAQWLDDSVINWYFRFLFENQQTNPGVVNAAFMPTHFMVCLLEHGYNEVKKWKTVDIFDHEKILIPFQKGRHWKLAVIDFPSKKFIMYDSVGQRDDHSMKVIAIYLHEQYKERLGVDMEAGEWSIDYPLDYPRQRNGFDCGVFVCAFASDILLGAEFSFKQNDMITIRQRDDQGEALTRFPNTEKSKPHTHTLTQTLKSIESAKQTCHGVSRVHSH